MAARHRSVERLDTPRSFRLSVDPSGRGEEEEEKGGSVPAEITRVVEVLVLGEKAKGPMEWKGNGTCCEGRGRPSTPPLADLVKCDAR